MSTPVCERCGLARSNCGPFRAEDGRHYGLLCGPCKIAMTLTPARRARLNALVQALAEEAARQEKAEAIDTVGVEVDPTALPAHPSGHGACDPETPCPDCATAYGRLDAAEGDAGLLEGTEG